MELKRKKSCVLPTRNILSSLILFSLFTVAFYAVYVRNGCHITMQSALVGCNQPTRSLYNNAGNRSKSETVHILFNAYMRGGSTFTSALAHNRTDVFFYYEPLWKLTSWGYFHANQICDTRTSICRNTSKTATMEPAFSNLKRFSSPDESPLQTAHRVLEAVFTCKMTTPGFSSVIEQTLVFDIGGPSWDRYKHCRTHGLTWLKQALSIYSDDCLPELDSTCADSNIRIAKVLRLCLDTVAPLLDMDPLLKIVHVFRDPRGTLNSRIITTDWYPLTSNDHKKIIANAKSLCTKMLNDYTAGRDLLRQYPGRFMFVRYEDLNWDYSYVVKRKLFEFLGVGYTQQNEKPFTRGRSEQTGKYHNRTGFSWRKLLPLNILKEIDSICDEVYTDIGYIRLTDEVQLRNLSIRSFKTMDVFDINE